MLIYGPGNVSFEVLISADFECGSCNNNGTLIFALLPWSIISGLKEITAIGHEKPTLTGKQKNDRFEWKCFLV